MGNFKQGRIGQWINNLDRCYEKEKRFTRSMDKKCWYVMISNVGVFTTDVLYHQSSYNRFIYNYEKKSTAKTEMASEESLCSLLKRDHNFNYKRDFGTRALMSPYRSSQRNSKHKPGLMSLHKKMKFSIKDFFK